jgi:IS5 family transposase
MDEGHAAWLGNELGATTLPTNVSARVFISRQQRGLTPTIWRGLRRRNAIEPVIGQMKGDGHLDRNFLLGANGHAINAVLAAIGHNLRLLRRWLT